MTVALTPAVCPLCGPDFSKRALARGKDFEYGTTGSQEFCFVSCTQCGCVLLDPRPVDEAIASLYPSDYEPYRFDALPPLVRAGRELVQRRKVDVVRKYAPAQAQIVDVGCGAGALLRLLRRFGNPSWRLCGWDFPGPHLEALRAAGFHTISGNIDAAHVPADVDLFVLNQVIEHFPDPMQVLRMLARALKPDGHILIETPDLGGLDARWFRERHWGGYHIPRHMVLFSQQTLRAAVQAAGLSVVQTQSLASPAFWLQSLHHRLSESKLAPLARLCSLRNLPLLAGFSALDLARAPFAPTSNQRLVARRAP